MSVAFNTMRAFCTACYAMLARTYKAHIVTLLDARHCYAWSWVIFRHWQSANVEQHCYKVSTYSMLPVLLQVKISWLMMHLMVQSA